MHKLLIAICEKYFSKNLNKLPRLIFFFLTKATNYIPFEQLTVALQVPQLIIHLKIIQGSWHITKGNSG